jgi:hypothetical protein
LKNRFIDIDIQGDFDGSVNIIFTDDKNNPGIINSRLKRVEVKCVTLLIVQVQKTAIYILSRIG